MSKRSRRPTRSAGQPASPGPSPSAGTPRPSAAGAPESDGRPAAAGPTAGSPAGERARRPGSGSSRGPQGTPRQGRRERSRPALERRSFLERNRLAIGVAAAIAVVAVAGAFFLISGAQPAFACASQLTPAPAPSAAPSGSPAALGQEADDLGRTHIDPGTSYTYAYCPPASGPHYGTAPDGPIPQRYYGPDEPTKPQGWVHNLEHGMMVVLYRCSGSCDQATLTKLQQFESSLPPSPICGLQTWGVVTRFDQMSAPIAAIVWDRVLFQQQLDTNQLLDFFRQHADRAPEQQCAGPSAAPGASGGSASPAGSAPASPKPSGS